MREQIRKPIDNQDLYDGAAEAFRRGWRQVKLYFMCGLPGERTADLDGIIEMAETIARIGKEVTGRFAEVTASVSNFIPKPHTPYQWNGMQTREYLHWAHRYLRSRVKLRSVKVKCHDVERSLLEGILTRGDRRVAAFAKLADHIRDRMVVMRFAVHVVRAPAVVHQDHRGARRGDDARQGGIIP